MSSSLVKLVHDSSPSRFDGMKEQGVAGKALALVELLANRDYPVQMSEIVQATGIPKPTAHRLINFLVECGYAQRHPSSHRLYSRQEFVIISTSGFGK